MILNLLKRIVKATLHAATEEWLLETGVPREVNDEARIRRESLRPGRDTGRLPTAVASTPGHLFHVDPGYTVAVYRAVAERCPLRLEGGRAGLDLGGPGRAVGKSDHQRHRPMAGDLRGRPDRSARPMGRSN